MIHISELNTIVVTINNQCNMRCPQCAYGRINNTDTEEMSVGIFNTLLSQCREAKVKNIRILGLSEPTLHKKFDEILFILSQYRPMSSHIITNGTMLLDDQILDSLLNYPPGNLEVSIDAFTADLYKKVRGGTETLFQRVVDGTKGYAEKLREGKAVKRWGNYSPVVTVSFVYHPESISEKNDFIEFWEPFVDDIHVRGPHNFSNNANGLESQMVNKFDPMMGCEFLKSKLYIDLKGKGHACTLDFDNIFILGDITAGEHISDMWKGQKRVSLVLSHTIGKYVYDQCIKCSKCSSLP